MSISDKSSLNIIILGCGRVGSTLARQLSREGHNVTVIDLTNDSFRRLGKRYKGQKIVGTGLDREVMDRAGLGKADVFIAVTQGDNTNIMAAQVAKEAFKTPRVLARIYDPIRSQAYREMGIMTLCTTTLAVSVMRAATLDTPESAEWQSKIEEWDKAYLEQIG
jgi:trk system potassium uptake protein TrkA